jgi:DNA (cytosine-5)-methyltransferase 1
MRFGSMFSGIGGIDLGLERAGMTCGWQIEIDDYCRRVLAKHWPAVPRWDDVRTFPPGDWPAEDLKVDVIAAGFPCQDISLAGKGAGLEGDRSGLFYEIIRVAGIIGPRFILLENVTALLSREMGTVLGCLASLGFDAEWHCVSAAAVGARHRRDRVFIVAGAPPVPNAERVERTQHGDDPGVRRPRESIQTRRETSWRDHWATEPNVDRVADGIPNRVDRLGGLGNAVVPAVAEFIARTMLLERECDEITNGETR